MLFYASCKGVLLLLLDAFSNEQYGCHHNKTTFLPLLGYDTHLQAIFVAATIRPDRHVFSHATPAEEDLKPGGLCRRFAGKNMQFAAQKQ